MTLTVAVTIGVVSDTLGVGSRSSAAAVSEISAAAAKPPPTSSAIAAARAIPPCRSDRCSIPGDLPRSREFKRLANGGRAALAVGPAAAEAASRRRVRTATVRREARRR